VRRFDSTTQGSFTRNTERRIHRLRFAVQVAFALVCIWVGVQFHFFIKYLDSGGSGAFANRPPGVEGFLPIASLMGLYYFFLTGAVHPVHPAGIFILAAILIMSFVFGKTFCSWVCPIGLLSEYLGNLSERGFRRRFKPHRILDYALRSLKYLILAFFSYSIFIVLDRSALRAFLDSPYNKVADIKMYYFFAEISRFAFIVIAALFVLSFLVRHFWCRYLCPYGALLGILSVLSPNKIKRNETRCIDCGRCAAACPVMIPVDKASTVVSDECTTCLECIDACPVADTLGVRSPLGRRVPKYLVLVMVVGVFAGVTTFARLTGHWHNEISVREYVDLQKRARAFGHPGNSDAFFKRGSDSGVVLQE